MSVIQQQYPCDLTDDQYELISHLIPEAKSGGRPRSVDIRAILNAIFYVLCTGCPWRWLPHDYPPKGTVYHYFRSWKLDGTWIKIHQQLRDWLRASYDRHPCPSVGIIDSQSVATATMINKEVGFDAHKNTKGRKRFTHSRHTFFINCRLNCRRIHTRKRGSKKTILQSERERKTTPSLDSYFCGWRF